MYYKCIIGDYFHKLEIGKAYYIEDGWLYNDDVLEDSIFNLEDYTPKYLETIISAYLEVLESVVK